MLEAVRKFLETHSCGECQNDAFLETGESLLWIAAAASVLFPCEELLAVIRILKSAGAKSDAPTPAYVQYVGRAGRPAHTLFKLPPLPYAHAVELAQSFESFATVCALLGLPTDYEGELCPVHLCSSVWCALSEDTLDLESAACGHAACCLGWQKWIHEQCVEHGRVLGGDGAAPLRCMQCDNSIAYEDVKRLTRGDPALFAMLERRTLEATIAQMSDFHWCPRCASGGIFPATPPAHVRLSLTPSFTEGDDYRWVGASLVVEPCRTRQCVDCQHEWCSACERPGSDHTSEGEWLPCEKVEEHLLCSFLETHKRHVKKCGRCGVLTEHNGGCSHMRCRCGYEWCWLCERRYQGKYVFFDPKRTDQRCNCKPINEGEGSTAFAG